MQVSELSASATEIYDRLQTAIETRTATFGVIGLGYVGLPLATAFAEAGFRVIGFDIDDRTVTTLNGGGSQS